MHFFLQLTANALVFIAVNIVGIFVHNLMEHAQRRAFLDTRNCIAARIEMEEENEKLERLLLSVLVSEFNWKTSHSKVCALNRVNFKMIKL